MKKSVWVVLVVVMMLALIGLGWAAVATTEVITVRKVIDGWGAERTGIFGGPKDKCDQFVEEIMSKIGGRKVKLNFIIPGYADPTGPSGANDDYGLRRAYNVGQYMKSKFIGTYEVELNNWSGGELKNMRAVDAACQIIPIISPLAPPEVLQKQASKSGATKGFKMLWDSSIFWKALIVMVIIGLLMLFFTWLRLLFQSKAKIGKEKPARPQSISDLVMIINNKDMAEQKNFCPYCLKEILGKNFKRHLFERCPKTTAKERKQLSEELNKQRPEFKKGESHEKTS